MSSAITMLVIDSATLFISSHNALSPQSPPPTSFSLLSTSSPLPPIPTNFPIPKLIPKTRFIIDGFRHAGDYSVSYFLSHFHSDHYTGLTPNWSRGIIFCSPITARLLIQVLKVPEPFVVPVQISEPITIDGCEVVLIDANHCPGAVQFLFKIPVGDDKLETYVHTGDFRYSDSMKLDPFLSKFVGADAIFLDTTYCNPKFVFPSQEESVDYIVGVIDRIGVENEGFVKNVLFLVATYVIGKEKILVEISRRCKRKIYVDGRKMAILNVLGLGEDGVFTEEESASDVHVVGWNVLGETWPYFRPNFVKVNEIMNERGYSKVVGFVPTGWTYEVKRTKFAVRVKDASEIHLVPYSEHSNYDEIRDYVKFLKPKRVIPTVGMDVEKLDSKHANAMQKHFAGLVNEMAIKQDFLMGFHRGAQEMGKNVEKSSETLLNMVLDQEQKVTLPETEASNCMDQENALNSFSQHQACSHDFSLLNGSDNEEIVQELRGCLPTWVTKTLLLDLLNSSGGNVVEAVSNFYECETEFYEQVIGSTSSACTSDTSLLYDSALPSKLPSVMTSPICDNLGLNKSSNLSIVVRPIKNSISPGKRKKKLVNKPAKKAKNDSNLELGGKKQCTITRFFSKLAPVASQSAGNGRDDDENLFSDAVELYKEEVDQFIQIIDGSESLRSLAHTILEEAKGDINLALDVYYSKSTGELSENKKSSVDCRELDQAQSSIQICYPERETPPEKTVNIPDMSVPAARTENVSADLVSLPPEKYSPVEHACWSRGLPAPYIHLARTFDLVENEKGKIKATSMLCNMFRSLLVLSPEDVLPALYLCTNKIAPDHENVELNIGGSIVAAALEEACGTNRSKIRELYNSLGDLGDVAQLCRQTQSLLAPPAPLSIRNVLSVLHKISSQTGSGSTVRKKGLIVNLMRSCREKEMKFLVRTLVRNLRIGAMMKTILPAVAQAVVMNSSLHEGTFENLKEKIQDLSTAVVEAYNVVPSLDILIPSLMDKGIRFCSTTLLMIPGIPLKPMLAKITNGIPQVLKLFQGKAFTCEFKYDGQRAQIHRLADGSLRVFSRNGDETTCRYPDLVNIVHECSPSAVTFVLDAEIVAVDRKNDCKLMSFQELSSRERGSKNSMIALDTIKVDICIFVFDIMFANGKQLLSLPLRQRREYMKNLFGSQKLGYFEYARDLTVEAPDAYVTNETTLSKMNSFLDEAFRSSCEGIMVKSLDIEAGYAPSKRSDAWLKVKRDYVEGLNDSLDLVPIGAWYGNGRKAGWYSPFLMACYDPETEEFQSVCRVMSGFSDLFYTEMKEFFSGDKILAKKPPYYQTSEVPDLWFSPELVWEIRGADFTVSPVHHAAIGVVHPSRGISVRFPRFICSVSDRKPEECSTATDLADMFNSQTRKMDVNVHH